MTTLDELRHGEPCKNCGKLPCECWQVSRNPDGSTNIVKLDAGKAPIARGVFAYFPRALIAVSRASEYGAKKYAWGAWKQFATVEELPRFTDAMGRHHLSELSGELYDPESGLAHAAQVAWNALVRLEIMLSEGVVEATLPRPATQQAAPAVPSTLPAGSTAGERYVS